MCALCGILWARKKLFSQPRDLLCLNDKGVNLLSKEGKATVLDYDCLDPTRWYFVYSFSVYVSSLPNCVVFGLFVEFGPHMLPLSARRIGDIGKKFYIIRSCMNYEIMEKISRIPRGCKKIMLVTWGYDIEHGSLNWRGYKSMSLFLDEFEEGFYRKK